MSEETARWRETISATWGSDRLPDAAWEVLVAVAMEGGANVTTAAIARRLGVSTERVSRVLQMVPTTVLLDRRIGRSVVWQIAPGASGEVSASGLRGELHRLAARSGQRRGNPAPRTNPLAAVQRAREALASDGPIAGARVVREEALSPHVLLARTPLRARVMVRAQLALLASELAMNQGRARAAVLAARRGLRLASGEPEVRLRLHAASGAASRMEGALVESVRHYDEALSAAALLDVTSRRRMRRWVLASASTPHTLMNDLNAAEALARRSIDELEAGDPTGEAESHLLLARALLWRGDGDAAAEMVALAEAYARSGASWVQGWVPRYVADVAWRVGRDGARWANSIESAWWATAGYGFQRALLLARVGTAEVPQQWTDALSPRARRSMCVAPA